MTRPLISEPDDETDDSHRRERGVGQDVPVGHTSFAQPAGTRCGDERRRRGVAQSSVEVAEEQRELRQRQGQHGQHQELEVLAQVLTDRRETRRRQPVEPHGENDHEQEPQPERGHDEQDRRRSLNPTAEQPETRSERKQRNNERPDRAHDDRRDAELERGRQTLPHHIAHWCPLEVESEVALHSVLDPDHVLLPERLVETELFRQ